MSGSSGPSEMPERILVKRTVPRHCTATVTEPPPNVSEIAATVLMAELQRLLTDAEAY